MKLTILSLLTLATKTVVGQEAKLPCSDPLTVRTARGTFTGLIDSEFLNTRQFRAIPFAKPPVLSRRWLLPEGLSPSNEHSNRTQYEQLFRWNLFRGSTPKGLHNVGRGFVDRHLSAFGVNKGIATSTPMGFHVAMMHISTT